MKRHFLRSLIAAALGSLSLAASAQAFPEKPIALVVPFAAGGPTDVVARMMVVPMTKMLGQSVVVENAPGAGGTVAATKIARAKPDGYTIFLHHMGMSTAPALYKKLQFDPLKDFEYIGQVVDVPMTLLGRKEPAGQQLQELQAYIKANGNKVSLANAGLGAVSHLCGLLFMSAIGTDLNTIPYTGTGPAMNALLGGQVDLLCDQTTQAVPLIKDGRVKTFGVTVPKRLAALPNIPTLDEQGLKGFEVKVWHGLYAQRHAGSSARQAQRSPQGGHAGPGGKAAPGGLELGHRAPGKDERRGLKTHLEAEIAKWGPVIRRRAGIYAD